MKRIVKAQPTKLENFAVKPSIKTPSSFTPHNVLFGPQLEFVLDYSDSKLGVCSRRAGKTYGCAFDLLDTARKNPNVISLYITLSGSGAEMLVWPVLLQMNEEYSLGFTADESSLTMYHNNGSRVMLKGAVDKHKVARIRGISKLKVCYIDEAQSFPDYMRTLLDDVIEPALADLNGRLIIIGTPPPVLTGYFWECYNNPMWSKHEWTMFQNPHMLNPQSFLERVLKRRGVTIEHPGIQREYLGKWVMDTDSLLIHWTAAKNHYDAIPTELVHKEWVYIMGIDVGHRDADALSVLAWHEGSPNIYLVEEVVTKEQDITALKLQIDALRAKYDISKMVMDTGGLGKKIAEELIRRYQLPIQAADKVRKMENVALLNDFLRSGRFKAKTGSRFAVDSMLVEIDRDKSTPDKIRVSSSYHSDIIDSVLYAFKECYAYTYEPKPEPPKPGTAEYFDAQTTEMEDAAFEHFSALEAMNGTGDIYD